MHDDLAHESEPQKCRNHSEGIKRPIAFFLRLLHIIADVPGLSMLCYRWLQKWKKIAASWVSHKRRWVSKPVSRGMIIKSHDFGRKKMVTAATWKDTFGARWRGIQAFDDMGWSILLGLLKALCGLYDLVRGCTHRVKEQRCQIPARQLPALWKCIQAEYT